MDISPCPPPKEYRDYLSVPRREFGRDIGNVSGDSTRSSGSRGRQRSALPSHWMNPSSEVKPKLSTASTLVERSPEFKDSDAMDVDSPFPAARAASKVHEIAPEASAPHGADLGALFFDSMSPAPQANHRKRRSLSPDAVKDASSSPAGSSPTARKFERFASTGHQGPLFKKAQFAGAIAANTTKRRRPALSALLPAGTEAVIQTAYPALESAKENVEKAPKSAGLPPPRRAFSALMAPAPVFGGDMSSDDTSADFDSSPAGAYVRRQEARLVRKVDGTADFRPIHGAGALDDLDRQQVKDQSALPQFGDTEAMGKILPCHCVKQDGLMRITPDTLNDLLDGRFDEALASFMLIDCRFDFEFAGGHIPGAVNISTQAALDELLLEKIVPPQPSCSGDRAQKTILVFHCEMSEHRAPTLAKHLRARDRALNSMAYPKIHYPEIYILDGGYRNWFGSFPNRCEPRGYVPMDHAGHKEAVENGLDQIRKTKFSRHRSYTYGDRGTGLARLPQRTSAPAGSIPFNPTSTRPRRGTVNSVLDTLAEGGDSSHSGDDGPHLDDSPCPPPSKTAALRASKGRALERTTSARLY